MGWQQRTTLRSICSRTLGHTSAHGVPNIIHSQNRWRSCCWAAFVFLVLGCMLWQCSQLTATYLQYPTQEKVTLVNSPRLPFPAITFCNLNRARKSQLNFSRYKALNDQLSLMSNHEREYGPIGNSKERNFAFAMSQLSTQEQMALGHQLQDMLISCVFHDESCNESFFTPFLNPKLGNCYTFNGRNDSVRREDEVLNATKAGFSYGLTMELYIEQHEYLRSLSTAAGLRVVLHGQGKMPFPEDEGVNVPPGQESDIGIVKVHVKRLQEPYNSRCSSGQSIKNYYADVYGKDYSREACMKSCAQTKMIKNCGCRVWEFPAPPGLDVPLCNISEPSVNNCVVKYEYKLSHDQLKCHCPLQCDEEIFELTLSSSQWPSNTYLTSVIRHGMLDIIILLNVPKHLKRAPSEKMTLSLCKAWTVEDWGIFFDEAPNRLFGTYGRMRPVSCQQYAETIHVWCCFSSKDAFSKRLESRRGHLDVQTIRDNVVKVVVYYQQLNYELIKEVPSMQLVDLFSSIGGLVGLWIGVSVCTVAEFLELILNILTFVIICIPNRKEECPQNPYTISDPQAKSYSPALSSDHCLLWDSVEDVSSLLRNSVKDDTTLPNPYQSCEKVNYSIYSV